MASHRQCPSLLRGWKAIEDFLGLTRKTALMHGYPVHRLNVGPGHQTVWAFRDELEEHARRQAAGETDGNPGHAEGQGNKGHEEQEARLRMI